MICFWGKGPLAHVHNREARSWQVMNEILLFIADHTGEGCWTLETGTGVTTLLFAMNRCVHICVAPLADEIQRIRDYTREKNLRLYRVLSNSTRRNGRCRAYGRTLWTWCCSTVHMVSRCRSTIDTTRPTGSRFVAFYFWMIRSCGP
jgi:hypothetical protein